MEGHGPEGFPPEASPTDKFGGFPERSKGPDCKSGGLAFAGSNPAPSRLARPAEGGVPVFSRAIPGGCL